MSTDLTFTQKLRMKVIRFHHEHVKYRVIARKLNMSLRFVQNTIKLFEETGGVRDRKRTGRPHKLTPASVRKLVKTVKGRERQSTRKVAASFKPKVSKNTINRTLKAEGLIAHRKKRRPLLTAAHKLRRVAFATKYRHHVWDDYLFWDEKVFELTHLPNPKDDVVWDKRGAEYFKEQVAHPVTYNIGVGICNQGATKVVPYTGTIDSPKFITMAEEVLDDVYNMLSEREWTWLMDNASCHKSKETQGWMVDMVRHLFPCKEWPANSPDINPIENIFGYIQDIVDEKHPEDLASLKKIVDNEFRKLTPEKCQSFISVLPDRLKRIIASKGEYCYD